MQQPTSHRNVLLFGILGEEPGGVAWTLLQRCREHPVVEHWWLAIAEDTQLQIEHALELSHKDLVVFLIDGEGAGPALEFHSVETVADLQMLPANAPVTPEEILHTLATLGRGAAVPLCYVLTVRPDSADSVEQGFATLLSLLENPQPEHWASLAS
jgi:hypothetical protein